MEDTLALVVWPEVVLDAEAADAQLGDGAQLLEVIAERGFGILRRHLALQQLRFQLPEEGALVVAQLRLDPVLRVEEDLAIGLPDPVGLHPAPAVAVDRARVDQLFEAHVAALNEELDRGYRLLDPR